MAKITKQKILNVTADDKVEELSAEDFTRQIAKQVGANIQTQEQIQHERSVFILTGIISEQWANLVRAEKWVKENHPPISPTVLVGVARKDLDEQLAELKKLDPKLYEVASRRPM